MTENGIATEFAGRWRKSTRSSNAASCVEVARAAGVVGIRDSKNGAGPVLVLTPSAFAGLRMLSAGWRRSRSSHTPVS